MLAAPSQLNPFGTGVAFIVGGWWAQRGGGW